VEPLMDEAALVDATGNLDRADSLFRQAVHLEPENARTWYELGAFYFEHRYWRLAYDALNNSYTYDRFGLAAQPCGLLDRARWNAGFRFGPKCPATRRSSSPSAGSCAARRAGRRGARRCRGRAGVPPSPG